MVKLLPLLILLISSSASADVIFGFPVVASEQGWVCTPAGSLVCAGGNNGASPNNVYVAGFVQAVNTRFRDWFEFPIPDLSSPPFNSSTFSSAVLFLIEST